MQGTKITTSMNLIESTDSQVIRSRLSWIYVERDKRYS